MKEIPLSTGKYHVFKNRDIKNKGKYFALVDDEDYEYLSQFSWSACVASNTVYATRGIYENSVRKTIHLHREIMNINDKHTQVDHIDHNGLNNQKCNLRVCTHQENMRNKSKSKTRKCSSKYLGVNLNKAISSNGTVHFRWRAQIWSNGKKKMLGLFKIEEDAARAYDAKASEFHGEFANLNFPKVKHLEVG